MVLSPFRRVAAWADAERDAHTIVIATLSLSREGRGRRCHPPVLPVLGAPHGARRVGGLRLRDDAEMLVRPLGDVESGQDHVHDEEGWLWL